MEDPFKILGIPKISTEAQVRQAFRQQALLHHPDKAGPAGEEKMKEVNAAYEKIMSKAKSPSAAVPSSSSTAFSQSRQGPNVFTSTPIIGASQLKREEDQLRENFQYFLLMFQEYFNTLASQTSKSKNLRANFDRNRLEWEKLIGISQPGAVGELCRQIGAILNQLKQAKIDDASNLNEFHDLFYRKLTIEKMLTEAGIDEMLRDENQAGDGYLMWCVKDSFWREQSSG